MGVRDISLFCRGGSPKSKAVHIEIFCGNKPMSARIAVKAVQKYCHIRGLLCSVRNRVPGYGPLMARYAKRALMGQTALSVFLVTALIPS